MYESKDIDGLMDLTKLVGKEIRHPLGIGTLIQLPSTKFAIKLKVRCVAEMCSEDEEIYVIDGPDKGEWSYVYDGREVVADLRHHQYVCDIHRRRRTVSIALREDLIFFINQVKDKGESRSHFIEKVILSYIENMEPYERE